MFLGAIAYAYEPLSIGLPRTHEIGVVMDMAING